MVNILETMEFKDFESITNIENLGYRITVVENNGRVFLIPQQIQHI